MTLLVTFIVNVCVSLCLNREDRNDRSNCLGAHYRPVYIQISRPRIFGSSRFSVIFNQKLMAILLTLIMLNRQKIYVQKIEALLAIAYEAQCYSVYIKFRRLKCSQPLPTRHSLVSCIHYSHLSHDNSCFFLSLFLIYLKVKFLVTFIVLNIS